MKKIVLLSVLCVAAMTTFAQSNDKPVYLNNANCKAFPNMPKGAVPTFPKSAYTPLEDPSCPPCYKYRSKYGYMVMECPYLRFPAQNELTNEEAVNVPQNTASLNATENTGTLEANYHKAYTGNYPPICKVSPRMPKGAKPAWPKGEYTALEDPSCAPCYTYRSKYGYEVMECPFLRFPAEHR